jgi:hypothetical protein
MRMRAQVIEAQSLADGKLAEPTRSLVVDARVHTRDQAAV